MTNSPVTCLLLCSLLPLFSLCAMPDYHPIHAVKQSQKMAKLKKQYQKLFAIYCRVQNKNYVSVSEVKFRFKSFIKNMGYFIQKSDNPLEHINLDYQEGANPRVVIKPDKRINVDFVEIDNEDETKFELNQFSDLTENEHKQMFSMDQSFFNEDKYPTKMEDHESTFKGPKGVERVRKYVKKMQAQGVQYGQKVLDGIFQGNLLISVD